MNKIEILFRIVLMVAIIVWTSMLVGMHERVAKMERVLDLPEQSIFKYTDTKRPLTYPDASPENYPMMHNGKQFAVYHIGGDQSPEGARKKLIEIVKEFDAIKKEEAQKTLFLKQAENVFKGGGDGCTLTLKQEGDVWRWACQTHKDKPCRNIVTQCNLGSGVQAQ